VGGLPGGGGVLSFDVSLDRSPLRVQDPQLAPGTPQAACKEVAGHSRPLMVRGFGAL
jgi:hypothetical protein